MTKYFIAFKMQNRIPGKILGIGGTAEEALQFAESKAIATDKIVSYPATERLYNEVKEWGGLIGYKLTWDFADLDPQERTN